MHNQQSGASLAAAVSHQTCFCTSRWFNEPDPASTLSRAAEERIPYGRAAREEEPFANCHPCGGHGCADLLGPQPGRMTIQRARALRLDDSHAYKTTIGRRESRCRRSCQCDAAPLFPQHPEGERVIKAPLRSMCQNCAGELGAFSWIQ